MKDSIKINELQEADNITNDDYIVIETKDGTKKSKITQFNYDDRINDLENNIKEIKDKISDNPDTPPTGKKYGVRQYKNSSDPTLERVGDAIGLVANAGVGTTTVKNDFDNIYPWSERKRCNLSADGKVLAYQGDPDFKLDGSNGNVMVETPKFYQKYVETDEYREWWIADYPADGFRLSPRFITKSGVELDKIYTGAYEASLRGGTALQSISGAEPEDDQGRNTARTRAKNIGAGWGITDIAYRCDILIYLFIIEFATLNSQAIMTGITKMSEKQSTGLADGVTASSGSVSSNTDGKSAFIYRGEENLWGNMWEWIDGCNINYYQVWVCSNPEDYEDDNFGAPYQKLSYINNSASGWIKEMGYDENLPYCCLPTITDVTGTSSSTYYCDSYSCSNKYRALTASGSYFSGVSAGLFYWDCYQTFDYTGLISARISYKPV